MNVHYRILKVDNLERGIIVRYFTDILTEDMLANSIDDAGSIMRTDEGYPIRCRTDWNYTIYDLNATEEDIQQIIRNGAPVDWFRMQEAILDSNINTDITAIAPPESSTNTINIVV